MIWRKAGQADDGRNPRQLLITTLGSNSPVVEAFRSLRTNIQFAGVKAPLRVIEVTSTGPGEGKSSVAANLACVMALTSGTRCILVDADLRKPVQAKTFGRSGRVGLTNVLVGSLTPDEALCDTDIEGLKLLPSGPLPPNPAELLGSAAMESLLKELRTAADTIIVDTPPVLPVTDAALLAPKVDGTLLVVRSGVTAREAALRAKQLLETAQARIIGVVLNGVTPRDGGYYHHYYHYYYADQRAGGKEVAATK
ncbi:MAG TPA: CpsD/CapB family tyrosine-protein kinase [Firmicutes bacterium]|nr:CpsD/CapB family tyrosine-protein kinase [Bacillota bacterium]